MQIASPFMGRSGSACRARGGRPGNPYRLPIHGEVGLCLQSPGGETRVTHMLSEMYRTLEYLRGISGDDVRRLRATGIRHTNQLLHRTSLEIDRARLSKRTGITTERLVGFAHQCTLMEVSGMER